MKKLKFVVMAFLCSPFLSFPTLAQIGDPGNVVVPAPRRALLGTATIKKLRIDFKTGSDNLEVKSFQENLEVRIIVQSKSDVILANANRSQSWPNNSIRRVVVDLPADVKFEEIKEIHLYRKSVGGIKYVWQLGEKDNWNLDSIGAALIETTGRAKKTFDFEEIVSSRRGRPLFRFIYDGGDNQTEGTFFKSVLVAKPVALPAPVNASIPVENAKISITFGTGGDDLRGGNDNVDVVLTFKSHPGKIRLTNVFNRRRLPNFSERSRTMTIPNSSAMQISDIKEVEVHHSGGGGIGADNWHVDKIKIAVSHAGNTKVLVDRVGAPLHIFSGDARVRTFVVE